MTWFIVPAGDSRNKEAARNRLNTLANKYKIGDVLTKLDIDAQNKLFSSNASQEIYIWGAKSGHVIGKCGRK